jgi:hypothetical protein
VPTRNDDFLDTLLREAGDSFAVPPSGIVDILGRIHRDDDERTGRGQGVVGSSDSGDGSESLGAGEPIESGESTPPPVRTVRRTIHRVVSSHKVLAVAASVLILLGGAAGVVRLGHGTPKAPTLGNAAPATHSPTSSTRSPTFGVEHKAAGSATAGSATSGAQGFAATPAIPRAGATSNTPQLANPTNSANAAKLGAGVVGQPARIEQTASLDLRVGRGALSATVNKLDALAGANGGFVANSGTNSDAAGGTPSGTVTLEVPVASFSTVLRQAQSLGKVSQFTTQATDVTAQYVDLQSQITALEASRQQYLTIMTKADSIGDVLAVQAQLNTLQTQIQQLQGQLAVLGSETDYSKITTAVSEAGAPQHHHPAAAAPSGLARAWHGSVHGFVAGAEGLIRIAGPALFALLCVGAVLLGGQVFWRRLQRHNL